VVAQKSATGCTMKEKNAPSAKVDKPEPIIEPVVIEPVVIEEKPIEVIPPVEIIPPVEVKQPKERVYIGFKKEKLLELLEKWRDMYNEAATPEDKEHARKNIVELERELKKRY